MILRSFKSFVYPHGKIHPKYSSYIGWSFLSNIIISTESVLSTHSMLSVVSSPQISNELATSMNYIGKDILGQLGGLLIMNKISEKADKESKKFIIYSTVCQQTATILECATPLLPLYTFIPVAGIANIGKNIGYCGFGAVNAKIIQKLAQENNTGEIYAKITVLNTLGSTIGMGIGLFIAAKIPDHGMRLGIMPVLAILRVYTYHRATKDLI